MMRIINKQINDTKVVVGVNLRLSSIGDVTKIDGVPYLKLDSSKIHEGASSYWLETIVVIKDKEDTDGNHGPVYIKQTKEEMDSKTPKSFLGSTKIISVYN